MVASSPWHASALTAFGAIAGYVLTRSVAVPFDTADVGNWLEPLGLVALYTELAVLALYGDTLHHSGMARHRQDPSP